MYVYNKSIITTLPNIIMHDILTLHEQAKGYLKYAQVYQSQANVKSTLIEMGENISKDYSDKFPLFLNILGHGAFLTANLLSNITFDAQLDSIQILPLETQAGISLRIIPNTNINNRDIIILDEMLDDGRTMEIIIKSLKDWGAKSVVSAVLCNKINDNKLIEPDYSAFAAPKNAYLFGCGMNINGFWSHLPDIWLLNSQ